MKTPIALFYESKKTIIISYLNLPVIVSLILFLVVTWMPGFVTECYGQSPWTQKSNMDAERLGHSSIALNGNIYTLGGVITTPGAAFKTLNVYDPILDSWTSKADMITGRTNLATCVVNGKILAFGGGKTFYSNPIISIEEYDPVTNTWTYKTDIPRARLGLTASLVDDKIYIIGGGDADLETITENDVYDTLEHTWTTMADIPTPRINLVSVVVNGKIYALGGMTGASAGEVGLTTVEEYDPATDTWAKKANMNLRRKYFDACVVNNKIYVFGGTPGFCTPSMSSVEMYDIETDTWIYATDIPTVVCAHSVAQVDGKIYVSGGITTQYCPSTSVSTLYEYDPHIDLFPLYEKTEIDKGYVKPGTDSVWIITKMKDTSGITLLAEINAPEQTPIDSLLLFDDGNHNDGVAGDSLYANVWKVSSSEEKQYYVDLLVTRIDNDTAIHQMNNMAVFTTIGPVNFENFTFTGTDTEPNPGDQIEITLTLKNNGSTVTAPNILAKIISHDSLVSVSNWYRGFGDLAPGEDSTSFYYRITISENWTGISQVPILIEISSNDYVYWIDTLYITVQGPTSIEDIREPIVRIYPNPTNDIINIEIENLDNALIKIYNISGTLIFIKTFESKAERIDISGFSKGIYIVKVMQDNTVNVGKVVVR